MAPAGGAGAGAAGEGGGEGGNNNPEEVKLDGGEDDDEPEGGGGGLRIIQKEVPSAVFGSAKEVGIWTGLFCFVLPCLDLCCFAFAVLLSLLYFSCFCCCTLSCLVVWHCCVSALSCLSLPCLPSSSRLVLHIIQSSTPTTVCLSPYTFFEHRRRYPSPTHLLCLACHPSPRTFRPWRKSKQQPRIRAPPLLREGWARCSA